MVKKLRFLAVMLCIISLITGCEFSKKYDGQVTAVIHNEADTFELAVAEEELISYYEKSNKLGYDLFKNNLDDNKIISPITLSNTLLDLSEIFNKDFSLFLNDAIPNFKDNIDAKDFSKSSLQDLTSKRAIWINYNLALRYNANALNFNNFKDFDFYLIDNLYETRNDVINAYV